MASKRSKATDISKKVRLKVYERDNQSCVICKSNKGIPNAHYISRAKGGLGIEENVITLCLKCHHAFDNGNKKKENGEIIENYLHNYYGESWNKDKLVYKKYNF